MPFTPVMQHRFVTAASFPKCMEARVGWAPTKQPTAHKRLEDAFEEMPYTKKPFFLTFHTMESLKWKVVGKFDCFGRKATVLQRASANRFFLFTFIYIGP